MTQFLHHSYYIIIWQRSIDLFWLITPTSERAFFTLSLIEYSIKQTMLYIFINLVFLQEILLNKNILLKMRVQNDENKRKLQQKYQKFKASHLKTLTNLSTSPALVDRDQNSPSKKRTQLDNFDDDKFEKMLQSMPKNDRVLQVMLTDPDIHQRSEQLKKQAQQNTMKTLICSFPDRYRSLLQSQAKLKMLQKCSKEKQSKYVKQTQMLMQKLFAAQMKIKQLSGINDELSQKIKQCQAKNYDQYSEQIKRKQTIIFQMRDQIEVLQKKCNKIKQDHNRANSVILQLRDQQQQTIKQTHRLVQKLKQLQQKLSKAHKKLLQHDNDKKSEINYANQLHKNELNEYKDKISHLQQLLQQSNIRAQYKQSLIVLSQKQYGQNLQKIEDQLQKKHQDLQNLRQEHLQALKTIDQLQQRINSQNQCYMRENQIANMQREQMKRNLDKAYQNNGQIKAQLQVKSQLIKMLQKSVQCLKLTFESDIALKNNEWLQQNRELIKLKTQLQLNMNLAQASKQSEQRLTVQLLALQKQKQRMQAQINSQNEKISSSEEVFRKYMNKIAQQQNTCCQLEFQIENWITCHSHCVQSQSDQIQKSKQTCLSSRSVQKVGQISNIKYSKQKFMTNKKIVQYQKIIDKLKLQVINLTTNAKLHKSNGTRIVKQLIQENKQLKSQLQNFKTPSKFIKLIQI